MWGLAGEPPFFLLLSAGLPRVGEQQGEALGLGCGWKRDVRLQEEPNLPLRPQPCFGEEEVLMLQARGRGAGEASGTAGIFPWNLGLSSSSSVLSRDAPSATLSTGLLSSMLLSPGACRLLFSPTVCC